MRIEVSTFIEVNNKSNVWAVELHECTKEMGPVVPEFIFVHNNLSNIDIIFVDNTLTDIKPEKIIEGVTGSISDSFKEVGFWRMKNKKPSFIERIKKQSDEYNHSLIGIGL